MLPPSHTPIPPWKPHMPPLPRSDILPTLPYPFSPTPPVAKPTNSYTASDQRNAIIGLVVLIVIIFVSVLYYAYIRLKRPRHAAVIQRASEQNYSARGRQAVERKDSRWGSISWGGRKGSTASSSVIPLTETPKQRERRWWGSVAKNGTTPPSPPRSPSNTDAPLTTTKSFPRAPTDHDGMSPDLYTVNGYDWGSLDNDGRRMDGFRGVVETEEQRGVGLCAGGLRRVEIV